MEDYDLVRRIADPPLVTLVRRFATRPTPAVLGWLWLHALHALGGAADRLAALYDSERAR